MPLQDLMSKSFVCNQCAKDNQTRVFTHKTNSERYERQILPSFFDQLTDDEIPYEQPPPPKIMQRQTVGPILWKYQLTSSAIEVNVGDCGLCNRPIYILVIFRLCGTLKYKVYVYVSNQNTLQEVKGNIMYEILTGSTQQLRERLEIFWKGGKLGSRGLSFRDSSIKQDKLYYRGKGVIELSATAVAICEKSAVSAAGISPTMNYKHCTTNIDVKKWVFSSIQKSNGYCKECGLVQTV